MEREVLTGSTDVARSDLISWSSIVAGVITAFGLFVLFGAIAVAAGLESADTPYKYGEAIGSIIAGLLGVLAFVVGGFVAAWTAHIDEADSAITHGFLVWALFVVLLVLMIALGAGAALGSAAGVLSTSVDKLTPDQLQTAGWGTVFAMVIALASSILGALLSTRPEVRNSFARR
jgi:MFS family permease